MGARLGQHPRGRSWLVAAATWLAWWVALVGVWLLLVDTLRRDELIVGAAAAALAATFATAVLRRGYLEFWPRAAWWREAPSLPIAAFWDCVLLGGALWRRLVRREPVRGSMIRVPFVHGGPNGRDGARRALVNFAISLTPNSYVVDIDPEAGSLLIHRLLPRELDPIMRHEQQRAARARQPQQGDMT